MAACNCNKRAIIDAIGKSVRNYYEVIAPFAGATTAGKTIYAGPIEITNAFEMCGGSGVIRSISVKELGTALELPFDFIFVGAGGYTILTNTTTAFDATIAEDNGLQDTVTIAAADYVNKVDWREARPNIGNGISVFNKSQVNGKERSLWFYLVARGVKTLTSSTRLAISITIESD